MKFASKKLSNNSDFNALGCEIRHLIKVNNGELYHCTLSPFKVSLATQHRTIEEIWFFISGHGQIWRCMDDAEELLDVAAGFCIAINPGVSFQIRNLGSEPLCFLVSSLPSWPGDEESVKTNGYWVSQ